jgi:hypothetical protein
MRAKAPAFERALASLCVVDRELTGVIKGIEIRLHQLL